MVRDTFLSRSTSAPPAKRPCELAWIFLLVLLLPCPVIGAEYWVNKTNAASSDANSGSQALPWRTVQRAAQIAAAGDLIHVQGGAIYDERVTPVVSGTPGNYITYKGEGGPVVRGFDLSSRRYVRLVGFEITHPPSGYNYPAVLLSGADRNQILDCNIHEVNSFGIRIGQQMGNNNIIRSNRIYNVGYINGTNRDGNAAVYCFGTNNLIEYNDLGRCSDFVSGKGYQNIIRNNYMHDVQTSYFGGARPHVDLWESQAATTNAADGIHRILFDRNFAVSNMVYDGHGLLIQSTTYSTNDAGVNTGDFIYRCNVLRYIGSYTAIDDGYPRLRFYNNTISHANSLHDDGQFGCTIGVAKGSTNATALNNIFYMIGSNRGSVYGLDISTSSNFTNDHDLAYPSGVIGPAELNRLTSNPLLVDEPNNDLHLQAASPAIGAAGPQARTIGSGTSTNVVVVDDARPFCDGWGVVSGDWVAVGNNSIAQVTNIDYVNSVLYLSKRISWPNGASVYLDGTQDVGAYTYRSGGYNYNVVITNPTNGAPVSGITTVIAAVTNPSVVRFVKFYVDGLEVASVDAPPYSATLSLSTAQHEIQARAYTLYPDSKLADVSRIIVNNGTGESTNKHPVAMGGATPTTGTQPLVVAFSSAGSYSLEGKALTYNWTFGNGATSTEANPTQTYPASGRFVVQLSISDGVNTVFADAITVTVNPRPPTNIRLVAF